MISQGCRTSTSHDNRLGAGCPDWLRSPSMSSRAVILLAHGSREPRWRAPFAQLERDLGAPFYLAFLELGSPTFADAVAAARAAGARELRVLPLFMAGGAHLERDVPALLEAAR